MRYASLVLVALALAACSPDSPPASGAAGIVVSDAWAAATPHGSPVAAGYMTIANQTAADVRLVGGTSPAAASVEIHRMNLVGGVMQMRPVVGGLAIARGASVTLKPGGLHLMFIDLRQPLVEGQSVPVALAFDNGTRVDATLAIRAAGAHGH